MCSAPIRWLLYIGRQMQQVEKYLSPMPWLGIQPRRLVPKSDTQSLPRRHKACFVQQGRTSVIHYALPYMCADQYLI